MQKFIALLFGVLLGMIPPLLPAQHTQNVQQSDTEIEALKKQILELEKQLQAVENVEKMESQTKLADEEFGEFERRLRDSNNKWLREWSYWFLGVIGFFVVVSGVVISAVGGIFWFWLRSKADGLIADEVENKLNGFTETLKESGILKNQLGELEEAVVVSMLEKTFEPDHGSELGYPEQNKARREEALKELREEPLLKIFADEKYHIAVRHRAAEVLASKSPPLVSPLLKFLNLAIDPDSTIDSEIKPDYLRNSVQLLGSTYTQKAYQGLKKFLNRLLTENPQHKDVFLTWTVFALGWVSVKLDMRDAASILKAAIPDMKNLQLEREALYNLVGHFDILNEPAGIKEILINHATSGMPDVKNRCLELLQKYDPAFVEEQRAQKTINNSDA